MEDPDEANVAQLFTSSAEDVHGAGGAGAADDETVNPRKARGQTKKTKKKENENPK